MRAVLFVGLVALVGCGKKPEEGGGGGGGAAPGAVTTGVVETGKLRVVLASVESEPAQTRVNVLVTTADPAASVDVGAWSGDEKNPPTLTDDLGTNYKVIRGTPSYVDRELGKTYRPLEWLKVRKQAAPRFLRAAPGQVTADVGRADVLYFEKTVPKAKELTLALPGGAVGAPAPLRFKFAWDGAEYSAPAP